MVIGFPEPTRCPDAAGGSIVMTALLVTALIQGEKNVGRKFAAFFQHLADRDDVESRVHGQLRQFVSQVQHFVQHEVHVAQRRLVVGHEVLLRVEGRQVKPACSPQYKALCKRLRTKPNAFSGITRDRQRHAVRRR